MGVHCRLGKAIAKTKPAIIDEFLSGIITGIQLKMPGFSIIYLKNTIDTII